MEDFRDCAAECGLADLGFTGYRYTWDNRRDGDANIQVRLDRAMCTDDFLELFPETFVEHIITEESDHIALLVHVMETAPTQRQRGLFLLGLKKRGLSMQIMSAWLRMRGKQRVREAVE